MPRPSWAPRSHQEQGVDEKETKITVLSIIKYSFCCGLEKAWQIFVSLKKIYIYFVHIILDCSTLENYFCFGDVYVCIVQACFVESHLS